MLEHLLFNGTVTRSQRDLYDEQDFYGIYNNAHTTREHTDYMVLSGREHFDRALDIQADMLFHSTLPEDKFKKEKGIVLNEIAGSMMRDDYPAGAQFDRIFFTGTPYNLPVLGLPGTIRGMTRDQVYAFYRKYYVPNNMTALIMGDFTLGKMKEKVRSNFGKGPPGLIPAFKGLSKKIGREAKMRLTKKRVKRPMIYMGMSAPSPGDRNFFACYLLAQLESRDFSQRVNERLRAKGEREILRGSLDVDLKRNFSSLIIRLTLPPDGSVHGAVKAVKKETLALSRRGFSQKAIRGVLASLKMEELSLRERVHYYGMMASDRIEAGGWNFARDFSRGMEGVTRGELARAARKIFSHPVWTVSAVIPGGKDHGVSRQERENYFHGPLGDSTPSAASLKLVRAWNQKSRGGKAEKEGGTAQGAVSVKNPIATKGPRAIKKTVLKNGLTLLVEQSAPGGIFALHCLVKNRSSMEPEGKGGIASLLHRLLDKGTKSRDRKGLRDDLMLLGVKLKTADDPSIPFDDYYLSREYSYIRFEIRDELYEQGLELLSDLIRNPLLDPAEVEREKTRLTGLARDRSRDAESLSRGLLFSALLGENRYDHPVFGTPESIRSISVDDLRAFHRRYFSPSNLILSVVSGHDPDDVLGALRRTFGGMSPVPSGLVTQVRPGRVAAPSTLIRKKLGGSQSFIRMGKIIDVPSRDRDLISILSSLLSGRVSFKLREKLGLSYSVWAGFLRLRGMTILNAAMGTTPDKVDVAVKALQRAIKGLSGAEIGERAIQRTVHQRKFHRLMRTLTRIGQAYYLGLSSFRNQKADSFDEEIKRMQRIPASRVKEAAKRYLDTKGMTVVIVD